MAKFDQGEKREFRNMTDGYIGVVTYKPNGDEAAIALEPDGVIWLSEAEISLTSKAPKNAKDNPFIEQVVPIRDPDTGEEVGRRTIVPLSPNDEVRPTPPVRGSRPATEEVGGAVPAKRRTRKATAA